MADFKRLREDHRELAGIAGRLADLIALDSPPPASILYSLREELASTLVRHLKAEDWDLYPGLLRSSDRHLARVAKSFADEVGGLANAFRDHSEHWVAYAIEIDWKGYRRETTVLLDALTKRIKSEDRDLFPHCECPVGRVVGEPVERARFAITSALQS